MEDADADWGAGVGFKIALFWQPNLAILAMEQKYPFVELKNPSESPLEGDFPRFSSMTCLVTEYYHHLAGLVGLVGSRLVKEMSNQNGTATLHTFDHLMILMRDCTYPLDLRIQAFFRASTSEYCRFLFLFEEVGHSRSVLVLFPFRIAKHAKQPTYCVPGDRPKASRQTPLLRLAGYP